MNVTVVYCLQGEKFVYITGTYEIQVGERGIDTLGNNVDITTVIYVRKSNINNLSTKRYFLNTKKTLCIAT